MAISKFAVAAVAAILAGGATAGLAGNDASAAAGEQASATVRTTPIAAIADPQRAFRDVAVQFNSGKTFGRVVAVSTNGAGRVQRIRVALSDMPSEQIWLDRDDLVYSRAHDVIIAHDVHAPAIAVADAR
ncbi:MAG: hypothetical protein WDM91_19570 [Rhizomicrobium sp.]